MFRGLFEAVVTGFLRQGRGPAAVVATLAATFHLAGAAGALAQAPTFALERITVEGLERPSAQEIVRVESLLREGETYSEQELREAVYRVKRLPFVVDADMALRRGSARGAYELVITVERARPFAYSLSTESFWRDVPPGRGDGFDASSSGTLGARKFVGAHGMLFASAGGGGDLDTLPRLLQVGYTHFGLIRGGYVTVGLGSNVEREFDEENLQASLQLGVPLGGNHALRTSLAWGRDERRILVSPTDRVTTRSEVVQGRVEWIYDSTDDPLLPRGGLRLNAGGTFSERRQTTRGVPPFELPLSEFDDWTLLAGGRRYWSVRPRQSVGIGGELGYSDRSSTFVNNRATSLLVEGIHALDLWDSSVGGERGDLRLESSVGVQHFEQSNTSFGDGSDTGFVLRTALVHRHAWGLLRLSLAYAGAASDP